MSTNATSVARTTSSAASKHKDKPRNTAQATAHAASSSTKTISDADNARRLWILIQQTHDALIDVREEELREAGLSNAEASILNTISIAKAAEGDDPTPSELSRWVLREPHSTSTLVARMAKRGLVKKRRDTHRKNQMRISVTDKGKNALDACPTISTVETLIASLPVDEQTAFEDALITLRDEALKHMRKASCPYPARE